MQGEKFGKSEAENLKRLNGKERKGEHFGRKGMFLNVKGSNGPELEQASLWMEPGNC